MVARLSELPALWVGCPETTLGDAHLHTDTAPARLGLRGLMLLERASSLDGVRLGGRGIPGFRGVPLTLDPARCRNQDGTFIRNRCFAVIGTDGSVCLRLPKHLADDLVDNGLGIVCGKNILTWPVTGAQQLEVNWRILLHAYWNITDLSAKRARRMWSEWVVRH